MRKRTKNSLAGTTLLIGCLVWICLIVGVVLIGPICFAYDLNHLVPLVMQKPFHVTWTNPAIIVGGIFLSEIAVPIAVIVWVLVTVGAL